VSALSSKDARAVIEGVLLTAALAPVKWQVGDISAHQAGLRLTDPKLFAPVTFYTTGYRELDRVTGGGFAAGECSAVSGPSSVGKTVFIVNLALNAAKFGIAVGFISLEMIEADILKLAVGITAKIKRLSLRHMNLSKEEAENLSTEIANMANTPLYCFDRMFFPTDPQSPGAPTLDVIRKLINDGIQHLGIKLWFIDYLGKVGPFGQDELVRMPMLTNGILDISRRTGAHICCLMQANKASFTNRNKQTGEMKIGLESTKGCIETVADFDLCIGLARDDFNTTEPVDPTLLMALAMKVRHGPGGPAFMDFHKSIGLITEPDPNAQINRAADGMNGVEF
jgi:replicative DNA helicase